MSIINHHKKPFHFINASQLKIQSTAGELLPQADTINDRSRQHEVEKLFVLIIRSKFCYCFKWNRLHLTWIYGNCWKAKNILPFIVDVHHLFCRETDVTDLFRWGMKNSITRRTSPTNVRSSSIINFDFKKLFRESGSVIDTRACLLKSRVASENISKLSLWSKSSDRYLHNC